MRRALEHARRGLGRTTPNPVVGACIVSDEGVVLGQGAHERAGEPHAEVNALEEAGSEARGATLYCTLEPCVHTGKTGPCTERIIAAGIRRVVAAMEDPFPLVGGRGFAMLRAHGIEVKTGIGYEAAVRLNQPFLTSTREWAAVRDPQGGDQPRRAPGRCPRTAHAIDLATRRDARALRQGTRRCGRCWFRDDSRRRSAADGSRGLPRAAAGAGGFRPAAADSGRRPAVVDPLGGTGDNTHSRGVTYGPTAPTR